MKLIHDTLKRLYPFWRPARTDAAAGMALLLTAGLLELLQPWPVKWLVDCVFGSQPAPRWMSHFWHGHSVPRPATGAALVCLAIFVLGLAHKLTQMFSQFLLIRAGLRLVQSLRCRISEHLLHLDLGYHDRAKVGDLVYRAAYDTYAAQSLLSQAVAPVATGGVILAGILVIMVRMDWLMTLIALAIIPLFWGLIQSFGRGIAVKSKFYHEQESALASVLQESLSSIRAIQAFTREPQLAERIEDSARRSFAANKKLSLIQLGFSLSIGLAMAIGTAAVVYIGAQRVLEHRLLLGDVLVFLSYLGMLYTPISAFAQSSGTVRAARTQLDRVFEVLDVPPAIADRPRAVELPGVRGKIEFRDVSFGYNPHQPVLCGINWIVEPGSTVALVGRTGSGKTTLASLIQRSYDPDCGAILLDGVDLRDLKLRWLRQQVSTVLQDAILFSGTVSENIAFGAAYATPEQIQQAARRAHAEEFILKLPHGYDTILGERGVNLSGGQRQRLSIARAFVKDAPILILDEPTSALDAHTESDLVASLDDLRAARTTFIIAHRLSTVRSADLILVLDGGHIAERGTHDELLASGGLYRELCRKQWGSNDAASAGLLMGVVPEIGEV